jgi:hypothetical protein
MDKVKVELVELLYSIVHALKIFLVYILPSIILGLMIYPDLLNTIDQNPKLAIITIVNVAWAVIAGYIKGKSDPKSTVAKVL